MHAKVAFPVIAGIAGLVAMIAFAFALTTPPGGGSDVSVLIPQEPVDRPVVGMAPNTTGLISQGEAVTIALRETGLTDEPERIEQTYAQWFYVDDDGQVYRVNSQTMEMTSTEGDMSRSIEKLATFDRANHYWVIALQTGLDSGYVLIIDAAGGEVRDESGYEF